MSYKDTCPKCGDGGLKLVSCLVQADDGPLLNEDGFYLGDGSGVHTSDERFRCSNCGAEYELGELMETP